MANTELITTLHKGSDTSIDVFPNIKRENIPAGAVDFSRLDPALAAELANKIELVNSLPAAGERNKLYKTPDGKVYSYNTQQVPVYKSEIEEGDLVTIRQTNLRGYLPGTNSAVNIHLQNLLDDEPQILLWDFYLSFNEGSNYMYFRFDSPQTAMIHTSEVRWDNNEDDNNLVFSSSWNNSDNIVPNPLQFPITSEFVNALETAGISLNDDLAPFFYPVIDHYTTESGWTELTNSVKKVEDITSLSNEECMSLNVGDQISSENMFIVTYKDDVEMYFTTIDLNSVTPFVVLYTYNSTTNEWEFAEIRENTDSITINPFPIPKTTQNLTGIKQGDSYYPIKQHSYLSFFAIDSQDFATNFIGPNDLELGDFIYIPSTQETWVYSKPGSSASSYSDTYEFTLLGNEPKVIVWTRNYSTYTCTYKTNGSSANNTNYQIVDVLDGIAPRWNSGYRQDSTVAYVDFSKLASLLQFDGHESYMNGDTYLTLVFKYHYSDSNSNDNYAEGIYQYFFDYTLIDSWHASYTVSLNAYNEEGTNFVLASDEPGVNNAESKISSVLRSIHNNGNDSRYKLAHNLSAVSPSVPEWPFKAIYYLSNISAYDYNDSHDVFLPYNATCEVYFSNTSSGYNKFANHFQTFSLEEFVSILAYEEA